MNWRSSPVDSPLGSIQPRIPVIGPRPGSDSFLGVAKAMNSAVDEFLASTGAVLLRGFGSLDTNQFGNLARGIFRRLTRDNPEHNATESDADVQTPVAYPADQRLLWHNENSFNARWPLRIMFGCEQRATSGGQTPLVDSRALCDRLDPALVRRFADHGVAYFRTYGSGVGLSWQKIFSTTSKGEVERQCRGNGVEFEWTDDGGLRTRAVRPAVIRHPLTGQRSWFNQAQHWHPACLDEQTREALLAVYGPGGLPRNCTLGDNSPIEDSIMHEILSCYQQIETAFDWENGDVLVIDNVAMAHGRNPYTGSRRLLVAMGEEHSFADPRCRA